MHDAILIAIDEVVIPGAEKAVKSITGLARHGTRSEVQNLDLSDFLGNFRSTPLMSASNRLDLGNEINRTDETRNDVDLEDGDLPAIKPIYCWKEHADHMVTGHNAPHHSVHEKLRG